MDKTGGGNAMIQIEYLNDGTLIKHYSNTGMLLLQNETGEMYADPIDVVPCAYTYTETDISIDTSNNGLDLNLDDSHISEIHDGEVI